MATHIVSEYAALGMQDVCDRLERLAPSSGRSSRTSGVCLGPLSRFGPSLAAARVRGLGSAGVDGPLELRIIRVSSGARAVTELAVVYDDTGSTGRTARDVLADVVRWVEQPAADSVARAS
jgi:hypothetical protein